MKTRFGPFDSREGLTLSVCPLPEAWQVQLALQDGRHFTLANEAADGCARKVMHTHGLPALGVTFSRDVASKP